MCDYESFVEDYNNLNITTHDVRRMHNLNSREYCEVRREALIKGDIPSSRHMNQNNAKFYSKRKDGTFDVKKQFKNEKVYIGRFPNEEIAKNVVKMCIDNNWVLTEEIESYVNENRCKPKNYSIVNGYYLIQKSVKGKNEIYAILKVENWKESEIRNLVTKFRRMKWNKFLCEKILKDEKKIKGVIK